VRPAVTKHRAGGVASLALLHFDGTNGSTTMTDVYANTWTAQVGAALSTAWSKFGPSSLLLNGSTDFINTPHDIFRPGSSDFTYECFANATVIGGSQVLFGTQVPGGGFDGLIFYLNAGQLSMLCSNAGGTAWLVNQTAGATVVANVPHHYAFVRHGNNFDAYFDGTSQFTVTVSGTIGSAQAGMAIGSAHQGNASSPWAGYIDEARVSNVARYTANFTPPSSPFTF
jgi:Concanavalin A-like lectin/glucanases superfamily